jgi:hypothetical protein
VESNILATKRLKTRSGRDKKKQKEYVPSSSHAATSDPKIDEMDKMLKMLVVELDYIPYSEVLCFLAVFIPHEDFTPQKYVHSSVRTTQCTFFAHTFFHYYTLDHLYLDSYYHFI